MDNAILKKRLNTFKTSGGKITQVSDEVIIELLRAWEKWPGTSAELYRELGLSKMQMVTLLKKAKKLVKNGMVTESEFKEIEVPSEVLPSDKTQPCSGIELEWEKGKLIRFPEVSQLVDFLKKAS